MIDIALGFNTPESCILHFCPACFYTLKDEPDFQFSCLVSIDGNNSLKWSGPKTMKHKERLDSCSLLSDWWIPIEEVNKFKDEVKVIQIFINSSLCLHNICRVWRGAHMLTLKMTLGRMFLMDQQIVLSTGRMPDPRNEKRCFLYLMNLVSSSAPAIIGWCLLFVTWLRAVNCSSSCLDVSLICLCLDLVLNTHWWSLDAWLTYLGKKLVVLMTSAVPSRWPFMAQA